MEDKENHPFAAIELFFVLCIIASFYRFAGAAIFQWTLSGPEANLLMVVFTISLIFLSSPRHKRVLGRALAGLKGRAPRADRNREEIAHAGPGPVSPPGRSMAAQAVEGRTPGNVAPGLLADLGRAGAELGRQGGETLQ